jgi:hypothetical protein
VDPVGELIDLGLTCGLLDKAGNHVLRTTADGGSSHLCSTDHWLLGDHVPFVPIGGRAAGSTPPAAILVIASTIPCASSRLFGAQ